MSSLDMAVTHLNVPYGKVVSKEDLVLALKTGSAKNGLIPPKSSSIIASFFVETSVNLIVLCMRESGSNLEAVNNLYKESLADNMPRSEEWEEFVGVYL